MTDHPIAELTQTEVDLIASLSSTAPQPGDPASRGAIAQMFLDEDFQECSSFDLADIMLKHWDVRWKANAPGHDDLMVTPESIDPWLIDNPLPPQSERNCQKCGVPTHGARAAD